MNIMKTYLHSKWTSVQELHGWRHYEVKNVFINKRKLELFSVCQKNVHIIVLIDDIKNKKKWIPGWKEIVI